MKRKNAIQTIPKTSYNYEKLQTNIHYATWRFLREKAIHHSIYFVSDPNEKEHYAILMVALDQKNKNRTPAKNALEKLQDLQTNDLFFKHLTPFVEEALKKNGISASRVIYGVRFVDVMFWEYCYKIVLGESPISIIENYMASDSKKGLSETHEEILKALFYDLMEYETKHFLDEKYLKKEIYPFASVVVQNALHYPFVSLSRELEKYQLKNRYHFEDPVSGEFFITDDFESAWKRAVVYLKHEFGVESALSKALARRSTNVVSRLVDTINKRIVFTDEHGHNFKVWKKYLVNYGVLVFRKEKREYHAY